MSPVLHHFSVPGGSVFVQTDAAIAEVEVRVDGVLLLGACDAARLREVAEACAARGATLRHEPDATLRG